MALDQSVLSLLEGALQHCAPLGANVACSDPRRETPEEEVFYSEAIAMARAVPKRRHEFFAGRHAAHRAMERCNIVPAPVRMGTDRAPEWPEGTVGSISHCDTACAAIVADAGRYRSLAVDLEPDAPLPEDMEPLVCLPAERAWLDRLPATRRGYMARAIFSAKECAYKLQYPITGKLLDFSDVEIVFDVDNSGFTTHIAPEHPPLGKDTPIRGVFGREAGVMFSMMFASQ